MHKYVLENAEENARLEKQARLKLYSLAEELKYLSLEGTERVLDAGCGNAVLGRYLYAQYPKIRYTGADISAARLDDARQCSPKELNFAVVNLFDPKDFVSFQGKVDVIVNRYVMHHIRDHRTVLKNFFDTLPPGGRVYIIDIDGIFVNLGTSNLQLRDSIDRIAANFGGDLTVGRHLPALLSDVGFSDVKWIMEPMIFQGQERSDEVAQFKERLQFAKPIMAEILGGELPFQRFMKDYLAELANPTTAVFYSKFIVQATKRC